jgi:hypothetical protein
LSGEDGQVGVFEGRFEWASGGGRRSVGNDAGVNAIASMGGVADEVLCAKSGKLGAGYNDFPNFSSDLREEGFRSAVSEKLAVRENGDIRGNGFNVGDDVRRENDDALAGKFGKKIAKTDALFGIEAGGGFIDDEELGIVEERLRDADALAHAAGIAAERALGGVGEIYEREEFGDAPAGSRSGDAFYSGEIVEEFDGAEIGVDAEVLWKIAEDGAKSVGMAGDVGVVPEDAAIGRLRDGGEDAHESGFAGAIGAEKTEDARLQRKMHIAKGLDAAAIVFA